jgi:hypothetical protein
MDTNEALSAADTLEREYLKVANGEIEPAKMALDPLVRAVQTIRTLVAVEQPVNTDPDGQQNFFGVAPGAPKPDFVILEGLREKLLAPREIVRDEDGWLVHPDYPICDEDVRADKFLEAFGIESSFVAMDGDADQAFVDRYFEDDESNCTPWTPTPPEGDGWVLLEIYPTEDGPYALFARRAQPAKKLSKRQLRDSILADIRSASGPLAPVVPEGWKLVPDHAGIDAIVTSLYRRFKDWSKRGFNADEVTWCEVKADVLAMIAATPTELK